VITESISKSAERVITAFVELGESVSGPLAMYFLFKDAQELANKGADELQQKAEQGAIGQHASEVNEALQQ
jgi:hypothetical protein